MNTRVAFPVLLLKLNLTLEKGRRWSVVEHLILHSLCQRPQSAAELAAAGNLPRRLVIETVILLMRAGWVELQQIDDQHGFRATAAGRKAVDQDPLPAISRLLKRSASIAIDKISCTVFRTRDLNLVNRRRLQKIKKQGELTILPLADSEPPIQSLQGEMIERVLEHDETCCSVALRGGQPVNLYALVTVREESIKGLPDGTPQVLKDAIIRAATKRVSSTATPSARTARETFEERQRIFNIIFDNRNLVLGGDEHKAAFERLVREAQSRIVIHSTFISADRFRDLLPMLDDAAHRGVKIDILWGQSSIIDGSTAEEVRSCRDMLADNALKEQIRLHSFSTKSHAKLLLADNGKQQMTGIIGSCNWLSSSFDSFEASLRFSDTRMIAEVAQCLATLACGPNDHWRELTRDLAVLAANCRKRAQATTSDTMASMVLGAQHGDYIRRARDNAERRIVVGSHRLGGSAETSVFVPAQAASDQGIEVVVYYGRTSGPASGTDPEKNIRDGIANGLRIQRIRNPRMHAKFLVWDDDHLLITSQNWLSADPSDRNPYAEIGVYIRNHGIGREFVARFNQAVNHGLQVSGQGQSNGDGTSEIMNASG